VLSLFPTRKLEVAVRRLEDKVAVVTGGANGIGKAASLLFAREGSSVAIADRDGDAGRECEREIRSESGEARFIETDVSRDEAVAALCEETVRRYGGLDILVNGAGIDVEGAVVDTEPDRWQRVLDVNLASAYRTCRCAIPRMAERGAGSIVNVSSIQGLFGYRRYAAYAAAKAGMIGLTRQIAVDYADQSIRSNAVSPGHIITELTENSRRLEPAYTASPPGSAAVAPDPTPTAAELPPLKAPGRPEHVAYAILFLASDEAAHISGHNLVVDGISTARVV